MFIHVPEFQHINCFLDSIAIREHDNERGEQSPVYPGQIVQGLKLLISSTLSSIKNVIDNANTG